MHQCRPRLSAFAKTFRQSLVCLRELNRIDLGHGRDRPAWDGENVISLCRRCRSYAAMVESLRVQHFQPPVRPRSCRYFVPTGRSAAVPGHSSESLAAERLSPNEAMGCFRSAGTKHCFAAWSCVFVCALQLEDALGFFYACELCASAARENHGGGNNRLDSSGTF